MIYIFLCTTIINFWCWDFITCYSFISGNQPYVKAKGIDVAILNAVEAITYCLADTEKTCKDIPFSLD